MDVLDYHLQHVLRRILGALPYEERRRYKSILLCGQKAIKQPGAMNGVYILKSDDQAKFFGQVHCQNPFVCPVCSARIMEKYRARIASALDMLHEEYFGFMVTFTLPHLKFMSCREITDILYDTWKYFRSKLGNGHDKTYEHPYKKFTRECEVEHWVRVCEYTYSDINGWHPHFHCIFWCKRDKADKVAAYQKELNEFWTAQGKRVTMKYWKTHKLHEDVDDREGLLERLYQKVCNKYPALKMSVDASGKLIETKSSDYVSGWGSDREATGNVRKEASHESHYTPFQILEKAEHDAHWANIYVDFVRAVTRKPVHHRLDFSRTGICKQIKQWQATHGYDSTSKQKKSAVWKVVAFFNESQWSDLCYKNQYAPVLSNILYLAGANTDLMFDYLRSLDVRLSEPLSEMAAKTLTKQITLVEQIFNAA